LPKTEQDIEDMTVKLLCPTDSQTARSGAVSADAEALIGDLVKLCKLLADETRMRILYFLTQHSELHVRALCERLGESQPAVSHHLALMRVAGLIDRRREGKHNFYSLQTDRFASLLDIFFATMPAGDHRVRFEDYVLSHAPA
jgi:ArsR family transcriptional regulator, arsenate/arsenite/antimonite-responsive transcriptional repressor